MNKIEMTIVGAAITGVVGYVIVQKMKKSDIENKESYENSYKINTGFDKQEKSSAQTKVEEIQSRHIEADEIMKTSLNKIFNGDDSASVKSENEKSFDDMSDDLEDLLK
jgi:hypothetical protein